MKQVTTEILRNKQQLYVPRTNLKQDQKPSKIDKLDLFKRNIQAIPQNFNHYTLLKKLNLWSNQITKIENLKGLILLESLNLRSNKLTKLQMINNPSFLNFCSFKSLQYLSLAENIIFTIEGILHVQMPNLTYLWLHENNICNFVALRRAYFPNIQQLHIYNNKTNQLNCLNELKSLKLNNFRYGQYIGNYKIQNKIKVKFLFSMESSSVQIMIQKQELWKQFLKRIKSIINQKRKEQKLMKH